MSSTRQSLRNKKPSLPSDSKNYNNNRKSYRNKLETSDSEIEDDIENIDENKMKILLKKGTVQIIDDNLKTPTRSSSRTLRKSRLRKLSETEDELEIGSPPKQNKIDNEQPEIELTPSRLINKLSIENDDLREIKPKSLTKYQNARKILNSGETEHLPGRESEYEELTNFLKDNLNNRTSNSMYISGPPGTGKTACLTKILHSENCYSLYNKVYVNCTSIPSSGKIYKKICSELKLKIDSQAEKECLGKVEKYLSGKHKMVLLVLDEIDQLIDTKKQSVLYTIFEWPSKFKNGIVLIGIANTLDLTDRLLSRLHVNCELKPKLMRFAPYTKQQIVEIFKDRLKRAGVLELFPPATILLLAAKVSAVSGDVRRALDIGRRVIEIAEQQGKDANLNEIISLNDIDTEKNEKKTENIIQLKQVVSVLNNVYGASQTLNEDIEDTFPLQQKFLICTVLLILKKDKNKDITVGRLHEIYKRVCSKRNVLSVDQTEFVGLCELVETRGILRIQKKKEPRLCKVCLQWDEEEVTAALQDKQLIASILDDVSCLSK